MVLTVALCLLGQINPQHYAGALTDEETLSKMPVEQMTYPQLKAELARLDKVRTSFVGPVVQGAVGAGVLIVGAVFFVIGAGFALFSVDSSAAMVAAGLQIAGFIMMGIGAVMVIAGGIFLAIGLARLFPALAVRREGMERRDQVLKRLEGTPSTPDAPPAPLPPGAPADVWLFQPRPNLVLAEF